MVTVGSTIAAETNRRQIKVVVWLVAAMRELPMGILGFARRTPKRSIRLAVPVA
jgi:hypothetical protein